MLVGQKTRGQCPPNGLHEIPKLPTVMVESLNEDRRTVSTDSPMYLSVREFARLRSISQKTVRKAIHAGRIPAENWGSDLRPLYRIPSGDGCSVVVYPLQHATAPDVAAGGKRRDPLLRR